MSQLIVMIGTSVGPTDTENRKCGKFSITF